MTSKNTKGGQLWQAAALRKSDHLLAGVICSEDTKTPTELQVSRLTRRFVISLPLANVVAGLAYGQGVRS